MTGYPKTLLELNQLSFGLLEMGIGDFFLFNNLTPQDAFFNHNRVRRALLPDDIRECCVDTVNAIWQQLNPYLRYSHFHLPFQAKVLPNLSILLQVHAEDLVSYYPDKEDE